MPTFVLIHGGFHGGWCWKKVRPLLSQAGYEVFTPTLTGLGERAHLLSPNITLDTHVQDVLGVLEYEEITDAILVGHSMAGMVITAVAERALERLVHLVYLDACIPHDGENNLDCHSEAERAVFATLPRLNGCAVILPAMQHPFGVTEENDARWINAHLTPHPLRAFTDPVRIGNLSAFTNRRTYIACTGSDVSKQPSPMVQRAQKEKGWHYQELRTSHDAMVTAPRALAEQLLKIAGLPYKSEVNL